jgi:hypothetical protein
MGSTVGVSNTQVGLRKADKHRGQVAQNDSGIMQLANENTGAAWECRN